MIVYMYIGLCVEGNECTFYSLMGNGSDVDGYLPTRDSRIRTFKDEKDLQKHLDDMAEASLFDVSDNVVICYYGMKPQVTKQCKFVGVDEGPLYGGYTIACDRAKYLMRQLKEDPNVISLHRMHKKAKCEEYEAEVAYDDHMLQVIVRNPSKRLTNCTKTDYIDFWISEVGISMSVVHSAARDEIKVTLGIKSGEIITPISAIMWCDDTDGIVTAKSFEDIKDKRLEANVKQILELYDNPCTVSDMMSLIPYSARDWDYNKLHTEIVHELHRVERMNMLGP